jgi:hypothetical protein
MLFEFKKVERTPADALSDAVYAAMETGNAGMAREALAACPEELDGRAKTLRLEVQKKYGVRL